MISDEEKDQVRAASDLVAIVQETVERCHTLDQPALQNGPFVRRNDARDQVKGDQALGAGAVFVLGAVDREGDTHAAEDHLRLLAAGQHHRFGLARQPLGIGLVVGADVGVSPLTLALGLALSLCLALTGARQLGIHLVEFLHKGNLLAPA